MRLEAFEPTLLNHLLLNQIQQASYLSHFVVSDGTVVLVQRHMCYVLSPYQLPINSYNREQHKWKIHEVAFNVTPDQSMKNCSDKTILCVHSDIFGEQQGWNHSVWIRGRSHLASRALHDRVLSRYVASWENSWHLMSSFCFLIVSSF